MKITRKNMSHHSGPYYVPQWDVYRDGVLIGTAIKTGTAQDNYPWDWSVVHPADEKRTSGQTGLLSEAVQDIVDHSEKVS